VQFPSILDIALPGRVKLRRLGRFWSVGVIVSGLVVTGLAAVILARSRSLPRVRPEVLRCQGG
jgi:hypothetical protein